MPKCHWPTYPSNKVYVYDASDDPEHPDGTYLFTGHAQGQQPKPMAFAANTKLGFYIEQDGVPDVRFYSDDNKNTGDDVGDPPRNHVGADDLEPGKIQLSWEDLYYVLPNPGDYIFDGDYNDLFMSVEATELGHEGVDLVLDGLPEETWPEPNELSPGALIVNVARTRLDLAAYASEPGGTVSLVVLSGADKVTLWDSEVDGNAVVQTEWPVESLPITIWVQGTGLEGDVEFQAMFQRNGQAVGDDRGKGRATVVPWQRSGVDVDNTRPGVNGITINRVPKTYDIDVDPQTGNPSGDAPPGGPDPASRADMEKLMKWGDAFAAQAGLGPEELGQWKTVDEELFPRPRIGGTRAAPLQVPDAGGHANIWRAEVTAAFKSEEDWSAQLTLPNWIQSLDPENQINPDAKMAWDKFRHALSVHEDGHAKIYEEFAQKGKALLDTFTKSRFFGEAAFGADAESVANAKETARKLASAEYTKALLKLQDDLAQVRKDMLEKQAGYETITDHGKTQKKYPGYEDADNTVYDAPVPLVR